MFEDFPKKVYFRPKVSVLVPELVVFYLQSIELLLLLLQKRCSLFLFLS
jgi:hypothetical protein